MSEYGSGSAAIDTSPSNQELLMRLLTEQMGMPSQWVPSCELQRLRRSLATTDNAQQIDTILGTVALAMPAVAASTWVAARASASAGGSLSADMRREIEAGLASAERSVLEVERLATTTLATRALQQTGYAVRHLQNGVVSAIEARRGHSVLLVGVRAGGQMEMDWLGHSGDDCETEMAGVTAALAAQGLQITVRRRERHGNRGGGTLITRAARAGGGDLVAGLLAADSPFGHLPEQSMSLRLGLQQEA